MATTSSTKRGDPYYWDPEAAERPLRFARRYLRHVEGRFAGQPMVMLPWEEDTIANIFGWRHRKTGARKCRICYIEVPRKNGKSTIAAAVALYLLFADRERGAQVYSAASDRFQARVVFRLAKEMVRRSQPLSRKSRAFTNSITVPETFNSYQVLSRDAYNKHGLNAHGIIFDELHTQKDHELYDVLHTSTGARDQPLELLITTAGFDRDSLCYEFHEYALAMLDGQHEDPTFLPVIYGAEENEDWTDPKTWRAVNPSLGVAITEEYLAAECARALKILSRQNSFKRLHLNIWTSQETKWIDMELWDTCNHPVDAVALEGETCFAGLDLASKLDLTALILLFPPCAATGNRWAVLPYFWVPEETAERRVKKNRVKYDTWIEKGFIKTTAGVRTDYDVVQTDISELHGLYNIKELAIDRWNSSQLANNLEQDDDITVAEFGMGFRSMKDPTSELEVLLIAGELAHGGHPVLRWNADNVCVQEDAAGSQKPDKKKSTEKIDGIVALIMALGRAMVAEPDEESIYDQQGVEVL